MSDNYEKQSGAPRQHKIDDIDERDLEYK